MAAALVGISQNVGLGGATTIAVTRTIAAGNSVVVVGCADYGGLNTTMAFTDNAGGNAYDSALDLVGDPVNQQCVAASHKENHPGGSTTFTITFDSSRPFRAIAVFEFSGVKTSGALGGHNSQYQALPGTGADGVSSGSITPSGSPGILVAVSFDNGGGARPAAGSGFTDQGGLWDFGGGANTFASAETIATSASATAGTFTASTNEQHVTIAVVLLEAVAISTFVGSFNQQPARAALLQARRATNVEASLSALAPPSFPSIGFFDSGSRRGRAEPSRRAPIVVVPLAPLAAAALSSIGFLDSGLRRGREEPPRLRLIASSDPQQSPPPSAFIELAPVPTPRAPVPTRRPALPEWALAALVPLAISASLSFAPGVARAAPLPPRPLPATVLPLTPLQPFPSQRYLPTADLPERAPFAGIKTPAAPDGSALKPLVPFPAQSYLPTAESPERPAFNKTQAPAFPDGSTLASLQPFPSNSPPPLADPPARARVATAGRAFDGTVLPRLPLPSTSFLLGVSDLPPRGFATAALRSLADPWLLAPLVVGGSSYLPSSDLPSRAGGLVVDRPVASDGSALAPLQPFPAAFLPSDGSPRRPAASPVLRVPSEQALPALVTATLLPWFDPAPKPEHRETSTKRPVGPDAATLTALPFVVSAWSDFAPPPVSRPTRTRGAFPTDASILAALPVATLSSWAEFAPPLLARKAVTKPIFAPDIGTGNTVAPSNWNDFASPPARGATPPPARVFNAAPLAALVLPLGAYFPLSPPPERGKPPADPPLPPPWFLPPLIVQAPSAWADFSLAPARGFIGVVRAPAPPTWNLTGYAPTVFVPFIDSGEVVFVPTFPSPILVPFIPSGEVVPPPAFQSGVFPGLIASGEQVFEPSIERRPDQIQSMLGDGTAALLYTGATGRLYLTPLDQVDARTLALRTLRLYLSLLNFRREVAPGEEEGRAFRLSLAQIHTEQPKDSGGEANLPSIAFLPGIGSTDTLGIGGINILDDTLGIEGEGTAVAKYGEYVEQFTIEIVSATVAHRNGLVAGLKQALRMQLERSATQLIVPEMFDTIAEFVLNEVEYVEEPYADQNRRRALLRVTLTIPELFVVRGVPLLDPRVLIELGVEIVIEPRVDADVT